MTKEEKINLLTDLIKKKIIRELQPVSYDYRNTAYWHYEVLVPDNLPNELRKEYKETGELRW